MITVKREKLYDWIWTKGLVKSASELGTTPGKLKTVLLQANIPLPSPQYWTMRQRENPLPRTPLPESELTVLEVPQKQLRQAKNLSKPEPSLPSNHHSPETKLEATYPPIFKEIELTNRSAIISAYQQLSVPSRLPKHLHPLIDQVYRVKKAEPVYYRGYSRPAPMLWFHSRYEKRTPAGALIIADALLEALASVGATVKLKNDDHNYRGRYDAEFELEGAEFELSCHVPTQKDNPSKDQWGRPTFSLTNELLRFAVTTSFTWSKSPISHKSDESETDYVKRIFIRIISLIPKGRREIAARKAQQKLFENEAKIKAEQRQRHDVAYQDVEALLRKVQLHELAEKIRHFMPLNETPTDAKQRIEIADWIESGNSGESPLTESDLNKLLAQFEH